MSETSRINRKFERLLNLSSEQMCCRDYLSMDEQKRLAERDSSPVQTDDSLINLGTYVCNLDKGAMVFTPSENYKQITDSKKE